jgi:hypothetical protein
VSVRVILNRDGRPSGDAIAEFETEEEMEEAMKKDREHLVSALLEISRFGRKKFSDKILYPRVFWQDFSTPKVHCFLKEGLNVYYFTL